MTALNQSGVQGYVYTDTNGNGIKDTGETGLAGVTVELTGKDGHGNPVDVMAQTDATGSYFIYPIFVSNASGYTITEKGPVQGALGTASLSGNTGVVGGPGVITGVQLPIGQPAFGLNFGQAPVATPPAPASISGTVFLDANNDGVQQQAEAGIAGVTLKLTPGNLTATTDANGNYNFGNLTIGTYTLTETQPNNVIQGINTAGTLGGVVDPQQVDVISQIVVNGVNGTGYTFAEQPIPVNAPPAPIANNQAVAAQQNGTVTGNVLTGTGNAPAAPAFQPAARPRALSAPVSTAGEYALLCAEHGPAIRRQLHA